MSLGNSEPSKADQNEDASIQFNDLFINKHVDKTAEDPKSTYIEVLNLNKERGKHIIKTIDNHTNYSYRSIEDSDNTTDEGTQASSKTFTRGEHKEIDRPNVTNKGPENTSTKLSRDGTSNAKSMGKVTRSLRGFNMNPKVRLCPLHRPFF